MKTQRLLIVITVLNIMLLLFTLGQMRAVVAEGTADPTVKMPDGTVGYPETVLLRLIDTKGGPNVKLGATERGAGLLRGGESDPTYVQILAKGPSTAALNEGPLHPLGVLRLTECHDDIAPRIEDAELRRGLQLLGLLSHPVVPCRRVGIPLAQ